MTAVAWAIIFAAIEIAGALDDDRDWPGYRVYRAIMTAASVFALLVVAASSWRSW